MSADFFEIEKQLDGFDWWIWLCFGDRTYLPNTINFGASLSTCLSYIVFILSLLFYNIWPNEWFSVFYVFLALSITFFCTIESANEYINETLILLILGSAFWLCDPRWGFVINENHFETYLYIEMLAGGCIALGRRGWNALIWRELTRIRNNVTGDSVE